MVPDQRDYNWERLYPPVADDWRNVVDAILSAIAKLPDDARDRIEKTIDSPSETTKYMTLLDAAKSRDKEKEESNISLVRRFCREDQPAGVRALANHIWLASLDQEAGQDQKAALASNAKPLAKAVLATLLTHKQCPFGREMGTTCGRMIMRR